MKKDPAGLPVGEREVVTYAEQLIHYNRTFGHASLGAKMLRAALGSRSRAGPQRGLAWIRTDSSVRRSS